MPPPGWTSKFGAVLRRRAKRRGSVAKRNLEWGIPPPGWMSKTIAATAAIRGAPEAEARLREAPASGAKQVLVHPEEFESPTF